MTSLAFNLIFIKSISFLIISDKDEYQKLYEYALSDSTMKLILESGKELTAQQFEKVINYMINNVYFQNELIQELIAKSENKWLENLSWIAQVRYLKIVTALGQNAEGDKKDQAKQKILADNELGEAFNQFMNENPSLDPLLTSINVLVSNYL
jgi:hypothetical protein